MKDTIEICGLPFKIEFRNRDPSANPPFGRCNTMDCIITIDDQMPPEQKDATLIHEWIHAVFSINGIEHTEVQVGVLATELYRCGFRVQ